MRHYIYIYLATALTAVLSLSACNNTDHTAGKGADGEGLIELSPVTKVAVTVEPYRFADGTRSTLVISADQMVHNWDSGDLVGFWPSASDVRFGPPSQARFVYNAPTNVGDNAILDACGWSLIRGKVYYSYYPYNPSALYNSVPLNFKYQRQTENGSAAHLGVYDYLHASVTPPTTGDIAMHYSPVCSVVHLGLTIPEDYRTSRFTDMILSTSGNYLTTSATFNPSGTTPTVGDEHKEDTFTVSLGQQGSSIPCTSDGKLDIYCMMCPGSGMLNHTVTVTLYSSDGESFTGTFQPSAAMQSGLAYNYYIDMTHNGQARINLSRIEPANCYIVSAAGNYKFRAAKGCSNIDVVPASVKVFWETVNTTSAPTAQTLIKSDVSYQDGYIYFSTADNFTEGNALIAAYSGANGTGDILWSWHIWMTDEPAEVTYPNDAGILLDRNLGALSTTGNLSTGFYYQWGRKDPFMGTTGTAANAPRMACTGVQSSLHSANTLDYAIKHPNVFLTAVSNGDWLSTNYRVGTDWELSNPDEDKSLWYAAYDEKTKYDPCPPGYRVPYSGTSLSEKDFWGQALDISTNTGLHQHSGFNQSGNQIKFEPGKGLTINLSNGETVFYPSADLLMENGTFFNGETNLRDGYHSILWSNFPAGSIYYNGDWNTQYSATLDINGRYDGLSKFMIQIHYSSGRAGGKSVRCMKNTSKLTPASPVDNEGFGNSPTPSPW